MTDNVIRQLRLKPSPFYVATACLRSYTTTHQHWTSVALAPTNTSVVLLTLCSVVHRSRRVVHFESSNAVQRDRAAAAARYGVVISNS